MGNLALAKREAEEALKLSNTAGSLDIYIQPNSHGLEESNCLGGTNLESHSAAASKFGFNKAPGFTYDPKGQTARHPVDQLGPH